MSRAKVESIGVAAERGRTETEAQQRAAQEAKGKADALSLKLWHLTQITRLAALASEACRTLKGIEHVAQFQSELQQLISDGVGCPNTWHEMEDTSGAVLDQVANQLEALNKEFNEYVDGEVMGNGVATNGETTQGRD